MLKIEELFFSFGHKNIISNLSFSLPHGKSLIISGMNGSGKTTLLKLCAGFLQPTSGHITRSKSEAIAFVPVRANGLFPHLTGLENIEFFENILKIDIKARIQKWAQIETFKNSLSVRFENCSTGMKQILNLFVLTLHSSNLLFLDEPFTHFDSKTSKNVTDLIFDEFHQATFIITTNSSHFYWPAPYEELSASIWE